MIPDLAVGEVTVGSMAVVTTSAVEDVRAKRVLRTKTQEDNVIMPNND